MKNSDSQVKPETSNKKLSGHSIFFALLSGILLFLSFPKFGLGFIAWIAFVPLFIALREVVSFRRAFFLGWIAGLTACVGIIYWITYVVVNYGHLPLYLGVIIMLLLACYLSLYIALFAAGIVYLRRKVPLCFVAPVLWVCLEYVKSQLFTGFPWENLGYSQFNNVFFIQIADITGVFGLSFLIILLNTAFFEIISERSKKAFALAASVMLLWAGVYAYGVWRIQQVDQKLKDAPVMDVSLIQGNIDQSIKWNENFQKETINIYEELSLRHPAVNGGLIVWPETAVPFNFQDENDLRNRISEVSVKTKSWFIFGSMSYASGREKTEYFNSAYLLSPEGDVRGKYNKVHLVPYGEYVPLRTIFPFISSLAAGIGDFAEGKGFYPLTMGERKIGVMICYEGILPEAARTYKNAAAELLVNITNDAWFGTTSAPYQHLSMSIFRAVETRLYLVRAANTGISAIVDPTGKIIKQTEIFKKDEIHGRVKFIVIPTFYARHGDLLVGVSFIGLIIFFLWNLKGRNKNVRRKHTGSN
jgi:apolipoprotein N-acyltransferase